MKKSSKYNVYEETQCMYVVIINRLIINAAFLINYFLLTHFDQSQLTRIF